MAPLPAGRAQAPDFRPPDQLVGDQGDRGRFIGPEIATYALLLVALHDLGRAHLGLVGIVAHLATGPPLAEQIPALVERHLDVAQPRRRVRFGALITQAALELVLLVDQRTDPLDHICVVHASLRRLGPSGRGPNVPASCHRRGGLTPRAPAWSVAGLAGRRFADDVGIGLRRSRGRRRRGRAGGRLARRRRGAGALPARRRGGGRRLGRRLLVDGGEVG